MDEIKQLKEKIKVYREIERKSGIAAGDAERELALLLCPVKVGDMVKDSSGIEGQVKSITYSPR